MILEGIYNDAGIPNFKALQCDANGNLNVSIADTFGLPVGYQHIADLTTAVGLTVPAGATKALIQSRGGTVVWRDDGMLPTILLGMDLISGGMIRYLGNLSALKFIGGAGTSLNVSYYS